MSSILTATHHGRMAGELNVSPKQVRDVLELLAGGATIPFISRYRKEATGGLDEVQIGAIRDRGEQLEELEKRRETVLKSLADQNVLSPELEAKVRAADTMAVLEDLYLPYKPKRRTRATIAREKGLEPLATLIFAQEGADPDAEALNYISEEKGVKDADEALAGARDIIAEWVNEDAGVRSMMREVFMTKSVIRTKVMTGKENEAQKYKDYFEWSEPLHSAPSHRLLAMRRGENELMLMMDIEPDEDEAVMLTEQKVVRGSGPAARQVKLAVKDCYKRLLKPSMETEARMLAKQRADQEAVKVFAANLKELLMAAPMGQKRVLALDPGFRTGCKVVVLDAQGKLLHNDVIYPHEPQRQTTQSGHTVLGLAARYQIEAIAIGNGTAGRETEAFVRGLDLPRDIQVVMVNESGASVYSASEVARDEFPDQDVTVRGAVSIGRRLMDPLAELVKIDPKSIGVGQYQHDVDQNLLKKGLDEVVELSVNQVGVELNTASKQLLTYVSGLGPGLAQNIIAYRNENGPFKKREELKKVARLGDKAFEQCAGFLRIRDGANPLDASAVHPERYDLVAQMAKDLGCTVQDLMKKPELRKQLDLKKYVQEGVVGLPTLQDILKELDKPGRDPREQFEAFSFAEGIMEPKDLRIGMRLPGIVTNVTAFGAFVDVGVHQDGLVHLSQLANRYIKEPSEVVKVGQRVQVTVVEVDLQRKRIALSMKDNPDSSAAGGGGKGKGGGNNSAPRQPETPADMNSALAMLKNKFGKR